MSYEVILQSPLQEILFHWKASENLGIKFLYKSKNDSISIVTEYDEYLKI